MKKLVLIATVALMASTAFAQQHMVRFYGFDNSESGTSSFDVSMFSADADDKETQNRIALNYAYAINDNWQVGIVYENIKGESEDEDFDRTTMGLSGYYNVSGSLTSGHVIGFHYLTHTTSDGGAGLGAYARDGVAFGEDDKANTMILEYGHRWKIGSAWGMDLTYSPMVAYAVTTIDYDEDTDEDANGKTHTSLTWNFLKFDLLF